MSIVLLAPKALDYFKNYVDDNLQTFDGDIILELLDKACKKDLTDLKEQIVNHLKNETVMETFDCFIMVAFADNHKLEDLKNWLGNYLVKKVSPLTCSYMLDYSMEKNLPTLKAAIIKKITAWEDQTPNKYYNYGQVAKMIPQHIIIELLESAFKHDVDILKIIVRRRIYYSVRPTANAYYTSLFGRGYCVNINTFMEKNHDKINFVRKDIRDYIIQSTFRETKL